MGSCEQCSEHAVGSTMDLYFLLGMGNLPELRMVGDAVTSMIVSRGAVAILWPNRSE